MDAVLASTLLGHSHQQLQSAALSTQHLVLSTQPQHCQGVCTFHSHVAMLLAHPECTAGSTTHCKLVCVCKLTLLLQLQMSYCCHASWQVNIASCRLNTFMRTYLALNAIACVLGRH